MIGRDDSSWFRSQLLWIVAILSIPSVAPAQGYTMQSCISRDEVPSRILTAPYALALSMAPQSKTIQACANFCTYGTIPTGASGRGDRASFSEPYAFSLLEGPWCFCGNTVNGAQVAEGECRQQQSCLDTPVDACQWSSDSGYMIYTAATNVQPGRTASAEPPPPSPPPSIGNRPPNAPGVDPGSYEPRFPVQYEGAIQLAWRDNGDPDGDALTFGVFIMQYDWASGAWVPVPTFTDQYGNTGAAWTRETVYTFTTQGGLRLGTHYAWTVIACEVNRGPTQQCVWSGWSVFATQ